MTHGVLHIFPDNGLDQSILIAVLLGIFVLLFFCEFFGWVWAGLVVPGYLASVFAVAPHAGFTICLEAVLTFVLSRLVSDILCKLAGWSAFFGRERFFVIVLVSVLVRQTCELWFVESLLHSSDRLFGTSLSSVDDFSSIGLVLVPLLANMFWKLTLPRGIVQIGITVFITYLLLVVVLIPHTNLSFASFESTYEDVALDFLGSPKAYIILLTTAFIAAYGNLVYGWDYNGILVPSLLALTWFSPKTLVVTTAEALVLLYATKGFVRLPVIKHLNLEGPRKITTVFLVGFIVKFGLGWALHWWAPAHRLTDYFGFGYVLTSLVAVKMLTLKKIGRVIFPSLAVSLIGFVAGSAIGLILHLWLPRIDIDPTQRSKPITSLDSLWQSDIGAVAAASASARYVATPLTTKQKRSQKQLWHTVSNFVSGPGPDNELGRQQLTQSAVAATMTVVFDSNQRMIVLEDGDLSLRTGTVTALLWPQRDGPAVFVPHPLYQPLSAQVGLQICITLRCRVLIIAGTDSDEFKTDSNALLAVGHLELPVMEVQIDPSASRPSLTISSTLPGNVALDALQKLLPTPLTANDIGWTATANESTASKHQGRATLALSTSNGRGILSNVAKATSETFAGSVEEWMRTERSKQIARQPSPPPTSLQWLTLQQQIIPQWIDPELSAAWKSVVATAAGFRMVELPHGKHPVHDAAVLAFSGDNLHAWMLLATTATAARHLALIAPARDELGTSELASMAFATSDSTVLLSNLELRNVNQQQSAIIKKLFPWLPPLPQPPVSEQAWFAANTAMSNSWPTATSLLAHIRGFSPVRGLSVELVSSLGQPVLGAGDIRADIASILADNGDIGQFATTRRWVDSSADTVGLLVASHPAFEYQRRFDRSPVVLAWFSEQARRRHLGYSDQAATKRIAATLGIDFVAGEPAIVAQQMAVTKSKGTLDTKLVAAIVEAATNYAQSNDTAFLAVLPVKATRSTVAFGYSETLQRPFLVVQGNGLSQPRILFVDPTIDNLTTPAGGNGP
jgi:gamma-polyglutamate biosynthesis protein CapC